ncbi:serine/threonine-protein kinase, partial [Streptomyces sp. SM14]|uniref:serine/threonine-protein kinase n=2 Tax=unclassified Streptomyces TaxID=2593676 RepID=UPI0021562D1A
MAEQDGNRPGRRGKEFTFRPLRLEDPDELAGFRLVARLGSGGMGTVYLSHMADGRPTALKVVRPELAEAPDFHRQFEREVGSARRVQGRFIVPVLESDTEGPVPWLATDYVQGPSLGEAVGAHGPLPDRPAAQLAAGVADALRAIHGAGLVHRDLKPSNVLLAADGPRVIDFGIARAADATTLVGSGGRRVGTPGFMAPEQILGGEITPQADMFALGLLTCFAVAGRGAFGRGEPDVLLYRIVHDQPDLTGCPDGLRDLVEACLEKQPGNRPVPDQVIEACRVLTGEDTPYPVDGWLPAAVAAEVAAREAPRLAEPEAPGWMGGALPGQSAQGGAYRGGFGPVVIRPEATPEGHTPSTVGAAGAPRTPWLEQPSDTPPAGAPGGGQPGGDDPDDEADGEAGNEADDDAEDYPDGAERTPGTGAEVAAVRVGAPSGFVPAGGPEPTPTPHSAPAPGV